MSWRKGKNNRKTLRDVSPSALKTALPRAREWAHQWSRPLPGPAHTEVVRTAAWFDSVDLVHLLRLHPFLFYQCHVLGRLRLAVRVGVDRFVCLVVDWRRRRVRYAQEKADL